MESLSGKALGADYLRKIEAYLAQANMLPVSRDGSLNVTAIAKKAGIPKQSIYKNPAIRQAIEQAKAAHGVESWAERRANVAPSDGTADSDTYGHSRAPTLSGEGKRLQAAERRVSTLEQQNAALVAENFELHRQVKDLKQQLARQDIIINTGRRVPLPVKLNNA
jgi:predicted RNase H-like nuclease (RuvC/YqgF family)